MYNINRLYCYFSNYYEIINYENNNIFTSLLSTGIMKKLRKIHLEIPCKNKKKKQTCSHNKFVGID